jgi:hypothetical protein
VLGSGMTATVKRGETREGPLAVGRAARRLGKRDGGAGTR